MKKTLITALLLGTGLITAGCEKTYSVEELKKDKKLMEEVLMKCLLSGDISTKNCKNAEQAELETRKKWGSFGSTNSDKQEAEKKQDDN
ncbi:EexN family lipoprotein [Bartonella machadoae]|uniref:EexN family lipoprotein n=1 Tax=Bartonella machadoae TaxID=2893471 RepID=UPI001F4D17A3|nr:EexN family lipoprotein [Bartonella machadoae]UNE53877.1 EexN family lipoprotein [Bartonella machadoae]